MATVTKAPGALNSGEVERHRELIAARLSTVLARIERAGGDLERIRIVGVTKGFGPVVVAAARAAGLEDLGENYAQELEAKAQYAPSGVRWHFLGPPQRNKLSRLAPLVSWWHALDREAAVDALAARHTPAAMLIQINPFGDPQKHGCAPAAVPGLVARGRDRGLDVRGLMVVGPAGDPARTREAFQLLSLLGDRLALPERSMGMSDDFEMAVQEGATVLRLGRVLFGPRLGTLDVQR